jgi:hypothetical protein
MKDDGDLLSPTNSESRRIALQSREYQHDSVKPWNKGQPAQMQRNVVNEQELVDMDEESGRSDSSEGIIDHNPFTSADYIAKV